MTIQTKYEIGQHVWVVYENNKEVCVYDDYIAYISIEDGLTYVLKETYEDIREEEIILYEETDKLVDKIKKIMQEIREKEGHENAKN